MENEEIFSVGYERASLESIIELPISIPSNKIVRSVKCALTSLVAGAVVLPILIGAYGVQKPIPVLFPMIVIVVSFLILFYLNGIPKICTGAGTRYAFRRVEDARTVIRKCDLPDSLDLVLCVMCVISVKTGRELRVCMQPDTEAPLTDLFIGGYGAIVMEVGKMPKERYVDIHTHPSREINFSGADLAGFLGGIGRNLCKDVILHPLADGKLTIDAQTYKLFPAKWKGKGGKGGGHTFKKGEIGKWSCIEQLQWRTFFDAAWAYMQSLGVVLK